MISARAYGVLRYLQENPEQTISAGVLAEVFVEGRAAMLTALKELRDVGLVATKKEQINGKWVTFSHLPESGYRSSVFGLLIQQSLQNSNNTVISNSLNSKPNTSAEPRGMWKVGEVGYDFFGKTSSLDDDDRNDQAIKHMARKKADYADQKAAKHAQRITHREHKPLAAWTPSDVAYEFANRLHGFWHIKPWAVSNSRFIQALAETRKKYDTSTAEELEIMERFFRALQIDKYNDADMLWKMFIKRFPEYCADVKNMVKVDAEVTEEEQLQTAKSIARFED